MKTAASINSLPAATALSMLRARNTALASAAVSDDISETFPLEGISVLREAKCLRAVLPLSRGGVGLGWLHQSTHLLIDLLRAIGGAHLSCARLFEGHVNAFQLLWTFGNPSQRVELCEYVDSGGLLGVWNAPAPQEELVLVDKGDGYQLTGVKAYASGAGGIRRPLVTARYAEGCVLIVWPDAEYFVGPASEWTMHGMRASMTRSVRFNCEVGRPNIFGGEDDYHAQPNFSGGAWRFLAAQLGAGEAIVEMVRLELTKRGRTADSYQRSRMAQCMTSLETANKWILDSAQLLSEGEASCEKIIHHSNCARVVVERSLLDVMEMAQRSVGLQLFSRNHPCERVMRDLATYLRQPAPDALLEAIGEYSFMHGRPTLHGKKYNEEA